MKSLFEQNGGTYSKVNGYLIPNLVLHAEQEKPIGIWGERHLRHIKQNKKVFYTNLITNGKLNNYLVDINNQAEDMFFRLVTQMVEKQCITEELKADNQLAWIGKMSAIQNSATEIVNFYLIYA